jgi:hypothetical protein
LDLSSNNFHGNLPGEIGNCSSLIKLSLHSNKLSGKIPAEIGNLTSLNVLNLQRNHFSGSIPSRIQQCKKLFELRLSKNALTGQIPVELGGLTELQVILDLSGNQLSGKIPFSLGNLVKLERLNLSFNQLKGEIPISLEKLTSLHMLNLSINHLQGRIPSTFSGFPPSSFMGNDNKLCGPPLLSCSAVTSKEKNELTKTQVAGIIVGIVFTATVVCLVMLYAMLRIWCNWRKVVISNSDNRDEEKWIYGERSCEHFSMNAMQPVVSSQEKPIC